MADLGIAELVKQYNDRVLQLEADLAGCMEVSQRQFADGLKCVVERDDRIAELEAALANRFTKPEVDALIVAEHKRTMEIAAALVGEEREACARLAEVFADPLTKPSDVRGNTATAIAAIIRSRGDGNSAE
jgi:hypothetical protein